MKNCWFVLGTVSFSIGFGLAVIAERNLTKALVTGGITTISSLSSVLIIEKFTSTKLQNLLDLEPQAHEQLQQRQNETQRLEAEKINFTERESRRLRRLQQAEQGTEYADVLLNQSWMLYRHNVQLYRNLVPNSLDRRQDLNNLSHGTQILEKDRSLTAYYALYAGMHFHKIHYLLDQLFESNTIPSDSKIDVIDYGCGQALGSTCLINYLNLKPEKNFSIEKIILIEPSKAALRRGVLHLNYLIRETQNPEIISINKTIADLKTTDLDTTSNHVKIHILSNILDVLNVSELNHLIECVHASQSGRNYFICVSPYNGNRANINMFWKGMKEDNIYKKQIKTNDISVPSTPITDKEYWVCTQDKFMPRKITRMQKLFSVEYGNIDAT